MSRTDPVERLVEVTAEAVRRPGRWLRHHHPVRWILLVIALTVAAVFLAPKFGEAVDSLHRINRVRPGWVWVSLGGELASLVSFSVVTWSLLDAVGRPRFHRLVLVDLATIALSHAVPAGAAAGTALGYEMLEAEGVGAVEAGFAKVTQALISGVLLQFLLGAGLALQILVYGPTTANIGLAVAGGVMVFFVGGFSYLLGYRPGVIRFLARRVLGWIPRIPIDAITEAIDELSARMRDLMHRPRRMAWISAWSLGNWVFDLVSLWAALKAFGAAPDWVLLTVAFCISQIAATLPISPAGLGVVESALVPLLAAFGVSMNVALLGTLLWRLFNYWLPLPLGGLAYLVIRLTRRRATEERQRRLADQPAASPAS